MHFTLYNNKCICTCWGELKTNTYLKPTNTGRYLDFASNHPTFAKQVRRALTDEEDWQHNVWWQHEEKEERFIKAELEANGYLASFIKTTTSRMKKRQDCTKLHERGIESTTKSTASIPYVPGVKQAISRVLAPYDIGVVSRATHRKWVLMTGAKDSIAEDKPNRSGVRSRLY